jgi:hypothetical protein
MASGGPPPTLAALSATDDGVAVTHVATALRLHAQSHWPLRTPLLTAAPLTLFGAQTQRCSSLPPKHNPPAYPASAAAAAAAATATPSYRCTALQASPSTSPWPRSGAQRGHGWKGAWKRSHNTYTSSPGNS